MHAIRQAADECAHVRPSVLERMAVSIIRTAGGAAPHDDVPGTARSELLAIRTVLWCRQAKANDHVNVSGLRARAASSCAFGKQLSPTTWVRLLEAECKHRLHSRRGVMAQLRRPACAALIAVGDIMRPILTYSYAIIWTTTRFFFERRSHESYEEDTQSGSALAE